MNDKRIILGKLDDLEIQFRKEQKEFDDLLEKTIGEKNRFNRKLDDVENDMKYLFKNQEYDIDMRQARYIIDNAQEDVEVLFKARRRKIEDDKEDSEGYYRKYVMLYEEELETFKRKEVLNDW
ncbi:MAG: hypothetical protein ACRC5R_05805 [Mycoplasmatales bacterium]